MRSFTLTLLLLATPALVAAQTLILRAKQYLDVHAGVLVSPAVIVVKDGLILSVNPEDLPPDAEEVDLGTQTLLPGLIDMHTHLMYDLEILTSNRTLSETLPDYTLRGVKNAHTTLMAGFTTVRDVGSSGFGDVALNKAIQKGYIIGPEIFASGHTIGITGGHADVTGFAPNIAEQDYRAGIADGKDEVLKATRYQIKHGVRSIKVAATAGVLSFEGPAGAQQYTIEEMEAIVEEAGRHGIKVAAHAHGRDGILAAVKAGVHSIEHGSLLDEEIIEEMKKRGTFLVPTCYIPYSVDLSRFPPIMRKKAIEVSAASKKSVELAIKAGVNMAFGTDAAVIPHGDNAKEFKILVQSGMTEVEAIRTATLHAARLLGVEDRGVISAGKLADLIAVEGDPLQDITVLEEVSFVMRRGQIHKQPE